MFLRKFILKRQLLNALQNNELCLFYQPEWHLKTGRVVGVESLLRWQQPKRGLVAPLQFIPAWEEHGLLPLLTSFLFERALTDLKQMRRIGGKDLFVSVNLSATQLQKTALINAITNAAQKTRMPVTALECELTETVPVQTPQQIAALTELTQMGVSLAIDDIGTGYASLAYLTQFPAGKIKIDRSFVRGLTEDPIKQKIVQSFIRLGHDLNMTVVAEGVETSAEEKWLLKNGADLGQGFLRARPMSITETIQFLKEEQHG